MGLHVTLKKSGLQCVCVYVRTCMILMCIVDSNVLQLRCGGEEVAKRRLVVDAVPAEVDAAQSAARSQGHQIVVVDANVGQIEYLHVHTPFAHCTCNAALNVHAIAQI